MLHMTGLLILIKVADRCVISTNMRFEEGGGECIAVGSADAIVTKHLQWRCTLGRSTTYLDSECNKTACDTAIRFAHIYAYL